MPEPLAKLPPPHPGEHGVGLWLDEAIWGHRLWDAQSPWLVFLEFLNAAEAAQRQGSLLTFDPQKPAAGYRAHRRMFLRNILFNNDKIAEIDERHPDSTAAWAAWLAWMTDNAQAVSSRDFSYLKIHFHSFHDFASLVALLRSSAVEAETNKRWISRFVFPFGPQGLYVDLGLSPSGEAGRQYINFGRTGELLYMMLSRASKAAELRPHLESALNGRNQWNRLLALLQPESDDDGERAGSASYLPYATHPCFDRLAEDWLSVFRLNLPGFDAFPHLVTLGALHIVLYQLTLAKTWVGSPDGPPSLICEVVAPRKTLVRERSAESFQNNNLLPQQAIRAYLNACIETSPEWVAAIRDSLTEDEAYVKCRDLVVERVGWGADYEGPRNPASLLAELKSVAVKRHQQHVANVHRSYGRHLGLVSKRGTNKLRYAPSDGLLKSLVFANVELRLELGVFLSRLYERYGLIFGDNEAGLVLGQSDYDKNAFRANARRLEQRLGSLGMLRRLSDSCAYVENPLARRSG